MLTTAFRGRRATRRRVGVYWLAARNANRIKDSTVSASRKIQMALKYYF
jgi:hypothetical protein